MRQVAELVTSPCSVQSSPLISSSLFCFPDILCCALCGGRLLVKFLGQMTVCSLRKFFFDIKYLTKLLRLAPLGNRRRFGPAPVEDNTPPQLAQPSPTTFSKPYGSDNSTTSREQSPSTPAPGKWNTFTTPSLARERFLAHRGVLGEISLQRW